MKNISIFSRRPELKQLVLAVFLVFLLAGACLRGQSVIINEVMSSNGATIADEDGHFEDWIELHNRGAAPVNLNGWGLSDDIGQPFRWVFPEVVIPAGGVRLIWASGKDRRNPAAALHTNFRVAAEGETVRLTRPGGVMEDQLPPTVIPRDFSIGRLPGQGTAVFFFNQPTPGAANTTPGYTEILGRPLFSQQGGFYANPVTLTLSAPTGVTILYTVDGSEPDPANIGGRTYSIKNIYPDGGLLQRRVDTFTYTGAPIQVSHRDIPRFNPPIWEINTRFNNHPHRPSGDVFSGIPIRARAFRAGALPSPIETHTFFIHPQAATLYRTILVMSIVTDERHLFDYDSGIYVAGRYADEWWAANAPTFDGWSPANFQGRGDQWERHAHIEVFEPGGGRRALAQGIGIRTHGGWSRMFAARKSIRLYARPEYDALGRGSLDYPFWPGLTQRGGDGAPVQSFRRVILRNSGNDWDQTLFRDAVQQAAVRDLPVGSMSASRPVVHFINGVYWGIMHLHERMDQHFLASHYGLDPDGVAILEVIPVVDPPFYGMINEPVYAGLPMPNLRIRQGTMADRDHFLAVHNFAVSANLADPAVFAQLETMIDIENFATYYAAQIYVGNDDWPQNNQIFWRNRASAFQPDAPLGHDGRWRWKLVDLDFGFNHGAVGRNSLARIVENRGVGGFAPAPWATELFRNMLENERFRHLFINRLADMSTIFHSRRMNSLVDEFNARIEPYRHEHSLRWGSGTNRGVFLRDFAAQRAAHVSAHILEVFGLLGTANVTLTLPDSAQGRVKVNSLALDAGTPGGHTLHGIETTVFNRGATWRFMDDGSNQGTAWRTAGFSDAGWRLGNGAFGFGPAGGHTTELSPGSDPLNRPITTYFRRRFNWDQSALPLGLNLSIATNAGAVFYLNGVEILRHRMPVGEVNHTTPALGGAVFAGWEGLRFWVAADSGNISTRIGGGGAIRVTSWPDLSGGGNHAAQATLGSQPTLIQNVINGRPVVRFHDRRFLEAPITDHRAGMTLFMVARVYADGGHYDSFLGLNGAGAGNVLYHVGSEGGRGLGITQPGFNLSNLNVPSDRFELIRIDADSSHTHRMTRVISGESVATRLTRTDGTVTNLTLGASKSSGEGVTDHLTVEIAEVIMFGRELSALDRHIVESHLAEKYGFNLPVPTFTYQLPALAVVQGENILAAEIHLASPTIRNLHFDCSLSARITTPPVPAWTGAYFQGVPVTVEATPGSGYRFAGWAGRQETSQTLTLSLSESVTLTPLFERDAAAIGNRIPLPHRLADGPFNFTAWDATSLAGTYPAHMIFEQRTGVVDPGLTVEMDSFWTLAYNLTSRSRINGLGARGISFINTSDAQAVTGAGFLGSAIVALDTLGQQNIAVTWTGETVTPNFRLYGIRLQYRLGDSGPFIDVLDAGGQPVEYIRNASAGHSAVIGPVVLPTAVENQPYVQLRWRYYFIPSAATGARANLRLDDILITSASAPPVVVEPIPAPHRLADGPFNFTAWDAASPAGTYPAHMIFEQRTGVVDPGLAVEMDSFWTLAYNLTSRSRINGLGADGVAFINTSDAQAVAGAGFLGSAIVALDTLGQRNIAVTWTGGTVTPNVRVYGLRLQYRLGDSGTFIDALDAAGRPVEYIRNELAGHSAVIGPVILPAAVENQPYVQLRWRYYHISGDSGARAQLRLDNILIEVRRVDSYAAWRERMFAHAADRENPAISGPFADPRGEGVPNLLRYALDLAPDQPARAELPVAAVEDNRLVLEFNRDAAKTDIVYLVEASNDLINWNETLYDSRLDQWWGTDGRARVRITDTISFSEVGGGRFLRLRVQRTQ